MRQRVSVAALLCGLCCHWVTAPAQGQIPGQLASQSAPANLGPSTSTYEPLAKSGFQISPLSQPTFTPGILLLELETKFSASVSAGGGKAFSSWFADDAVLLSNGKPPVMGRVAVANQAQWNSKDYQLTWVAQGAQMGPSNDMGFTWGHYEGSYKDLHGQTVTTTGRYMTIWKKTAETSGPGAGWQVALESSSDEPPDAGSCCSLPEP
jgi:ketosteroid isomerase-like protein